MLQFKNGSMDIQLVSIHTIDLDNGDNYAIVRRLQDNTLIVVRGLHYNVDNNECYWDYAIQYDIDNLTEASQVFISKLI